MLNRGSFESVPLDVIKYIISYCVNDDKDFLSSLRISLLCKFFYQVVRDYWKNIFRNWSPIFFPRSPEMIKGEFAVIPLETYQLIYEFIENIKSKWVHYPSSRKEPSMY